MSNIDKLDLNLLVTLDVLLDELNVTKAARRLNLSQPSVSVQLAKLRDYFNDPLLVSHSRGMTPTLKAEQLRQPMKEAIVRLHQVVMPAAEFDPQHAQQRWRIAAYDYSEATVILPLLPVLRTMAPLSELSIVQLPPMQINEKAERGEIDLALHMASDSHANLHHRALFSEQYVLAGRKRHALLNKPVSLDIFCQLEHVIVSPDGGGFWGHTDEVLKALGLKRNVVLSVPHFLFLKAILETTDLVAMLPSRIAMMSDLIQTVPVPIELSGFTLSMLWHERVHRDPAHQWLRKQILSALI